MERTIYGRFYGKIPFTADFMERYHLRQILWTRYCSRFYRQDAIYSRFVGFDTNCGRFYGRDTVVDFIYKMLFTADL